MRITSLIILISITSQALCQDPTLPNAAILERLNGHIPMAAIPEARPTPSIKMRAMVMNDRNRGIAILESEGQRYQLRLERPNTAQKGSTASTPDSLHRVQIQGVEYSLLDFYDRTIILTDSVKRIIVQ